MEHSKSPYSISILCYLQNPCSSLLSFAKFLELLIYSPTLCALKPPLCAHTSPSPSLKPSPLLPKERMNIVRHFSVVASPSPSALQGEDGDKDREVSFTLSAVDYIFELRVPRLQMTSQREREKCSLSLEAVPGGEDKDKGDRDGEKKELRREIKRWWEGVADHMDTLVS